MIPRAVGRLACGICWSIGCSHPTHAPLSPYSFAFAPLIIPRLCPTHSCRFLEGGRVLWFTARSATRRPSRPCLLASEPSPRRHARQRRKTEGMWYVFDALSSSRTCPSPSPPAPLQGVPLKFAGVAIKPGQWCYVDEDGILVSDKELTL